MAPFATTLIATAARNVALTLRETPDLVSALFFSILNHDAIS
jgi:hypothetical protein